MSRWPVELITAPLIFRKPWQIGRPSELSSRAFAVRVTVGRILRPGYQKGDSAQRQCHLSLRTGAHRTLKMTPLPATKRCRKTATTVAGDTLSNRTPFDARRAYGRLCDAARSRGRGSSRLRRSRASAMLRPLWTNGRRPWTPDSGQDAGAADWLSASAAAAALGVSQRTVRRAIARGDLPAAKQRRRLPDRAGGPRALPGADAGAPSRSDRAGRSCPAPAAPVPRPGRRGRARAAPRRAHAADRAGARARRRPRPAAPRRTCRS